MALTGSGIGYEYGRGTPFAQAALAGVDVEVDRGELVLVVGATGSGKSTLLRALAGLVVPQAGRVEIDGERLAGTPTGRGTGIGLAFQAPETQLFAETVLDDVAFGPRNQGLEHGDAGRAARQALDAVSLDPERYAARSPFTLSGGEARRVALAGVIAMDPAYLLLDEPTAGLDAAGRHALAQTVSASREDRGVLVVSHDLDEFVPLATRVLVLREGSPHYYGRTESLVDDVRPLLDAGLRPPAVLEAQRLARDRGAPIGRLTLDVAAAADALADVGSWSA